MFHCHVTERGSREGPVLSLRRALRSAHRCQVTAQLTVVKLWPGADRAEVGLWQTGCLEEGASVGLCASVLMLLKGKAATCSPVDECNLLGSQ